MPVLEQTLAFWLQSLLRGSTIHKMAVTLSRGIRWTYRGRLRRGRQLKP